MFAGGGISIFKVFDDLGDAIDFRLKCIKANWDLPSEIDEYDENLPNSEDEKLDGFLDEELESEILNEYSGDNDLSIKNKKS